MIKCGAPRAMAWSNGTGITYEVAVSPPDAGLGDFDWRISIAEISADSVFSTFGGVDRILLLIEGDGMRLTVDGTVHALETFDRVAFAGEAQASCTLPSGPTRDLNIMTRRGVYDATLHVIRGASAHECVPEPDETVFLAVLSGEWSAVGEPPTRLTVGEFARIDDAVRLVGTGMLARICLRRARDAR